MRSPTLPPALRRLSRLVVLALVGAIGLPIPSPAQEGATTPHWIWHPGGRDGSFPAEARYFRKAFHAKEPSRLALDVTADNQFTLYLDGREVASGNDWRTVKSVRTEIPTGQHVLAAVASNEAPGPAGFLVRGGVLPLGQGVPIHTDRSWKTTDSVEGDAWTKVGFDDSSWSRAQDLGPLGSGPWKELLFESEGPVSRYQVPEGFEVAMVAAPATTGSAVAFTFDDQGRPVVSIERGPIALLIDADKDGTYEERKVIAAQMSNCQGLSFIRGHLYAVGDGPQKTGLYRLDDKDGEGVFESTELIRNTIGGMGEHGPHTVALGPDGCLYYNNGNHAHLGGPIDEKSPVNDYFQYEGELLPHYNDSRGHAAGILAPGGEIFRSADEGKTWQRIVAGFRNEYDFAFNRDGELFTFDSDMEWDIGLPWYRPVRVNHCIPGAAFGWRNGSGKWPSYYYDSLPGTLDIGRGSPTGVTFYQGKQFPPEYDDNLLICDWSQGRILAVELRKQGATYAAREKELVTGQPLNCTDIEVGPDGAVYFTTGGRGTLGGLYRVSHKKGRKPDLIEPKRGEPDLLRDALEMDSPLSSFSQRRLAQIKQAMGDDWGKKLAATAADKAAPVAYRTRALDLLTQFGPSPEESLLVDLSKRPNVADDLADTGPVRAKAVALLGMRDTDSARLAISGALIDTDPFVRRRACEALVRSDGPIPVEKLAPLLSSPDRWIRYAARLAYLHASAEERKRLHADSTNLAPRARLEVTLAETQAAPPTPAKQADSLKSMAEPLGRLSFEKNPQEVLDLIRLIGLTYLLGPAKPAELSDVTPDIRGRLLKLFNDLPRITRQRKIDPRTGGAVEANDDESMNVALHREVARLLAYLNEPKAVAAILKAQADDPDHADQIHYAYCLRAIKDGWTDEGKKQLWAWYEKASHWDGGFSYLGYLDFMTQELVALLSTEERTVFLAQGDTYPFPTRVLVRGIDLKRQPERARDFSALYARLGDTDNPSAANELRAQILEALGRSEDQQIHAELRSLAKADPARRDLIARALSNHPTADDLPLFVAALDSRDPNTTSIVLNALGKIDAKPEGAEALRNLIRLAQRTGPPLLAKLNDLAAKWTGATGPDKDFAAALKHWEQVYNDRYPKGPALYEAAASGQNDYNLQGLIADVLQSGLAKQGSPDRGKVVLQKAKCLDCHKLGDQGQGLGPDLTTVSSRFRPHEILESIVEPSKVISDQYKPVTVATADGKVFNGMPTAGDEDKLVLLLSDGTKVTIPKAEVEAKKDSDVSVMPEGLLNALSLQEIADMLALFDAQPRVEVPQTSPKK